MTDTEKLSMLKTFLDITDTSEDERLNAYLTSSAQAINQYKYKMTGNIPCELDPEDEQTQIWAVVAGFNMIGMENQSLSIENSTHRHWVYSDMLQYIHGNVTPYLGVG